MKAKFILLLFCSVFIFSCKNDKAETNQNAATTPVNDNIFKVTLNVISEKNDTFSLFYTEDGSTNFTGKPITVDLGGLPTPQPIAYKLPADVYPTQLRLDFGMNKDQEQVVFQSMTIEYNGKKKEFAGAALGNLFRADDSKCTFDAGTGAIKAIVKDGVKQFPSLYPVETNLKPELESLAK